MRSSLSKMAVESKLDTHRVTDGRIERIHGVEPTDGARWRINRMAERGLISLEQLPMQSILDDASTEPGSVGYRTKELPRHSPQGRSQRPDLRQRARHVRGWLRQPRPQCPLNRRAGN